jgi:plasmid stabilization system protein ParE
MATSFSQALDALREQIEATFQAESEAAAAKRQQALDHVVALALAYANGKQQDDAKQPAPRKMPETPKFSLESPESGRVTLKGAIREAVQAQTGEFARDDILDWIETKHPQLMPRTREQSVASMMSRLKGKLIETARKGVGTERHTYRRLSVREGGNGQHN